MKWHVEWRPYPHNPWVVVDENGDTYKGFALFSHYATADVAQDHVDHLNRINAANGVKRKNANKESSQSSGLRWRRR